MKNYDVAILGGGLAGLTLALQIKRTRPETKVIVLEKRDAEAPESSHKVGESTVELATHYLREDLDLKDYLDSDQLPKHGLRFFFSPEHKTTIEKRVELGPRKPLPVPSHQIDRGIFENDLIKMANKRGVDVSLNSVVKSVNHRDSSKLVSYESNGERRQLQTVWAVDATGRRAFYKKNLDLDSSIEHNCNAIWFRLKGKIDIDDWSDQAEWKNFLEPGLRMLGTIHLMDTGYWVWIIPLASGNTSFGIVSDPRFHSLQSMNTYEKALEWLREFEPLCAEKIVESGFEVMDFKALKKYSLNSSDFYNEDRWALTGEAGAFLDPFYSPGSDFIALSNTWINDLICRDLDGENIELRSKIFDQTHKSLFTNWIPIYQDKYQLFGKTQIMVMKIFWDWATYWAVPTLLFTNKGYTNISVLKRLFSTENSTGSQFGKLNGIVQKWFLQFKDADNEEFTNHYLDPFDLEFLKRFHVGIDEQLDGRELIKKVKSNVEELEIISAELFRRMSNKMYNTPLDMPVNPYLVDLDAGKERILELSMDEGALNSLKSIQTDIDKIWFYQSVSIQ